MTVTQNRENFEPFDNSVEALSREYMPDYVYQESANLRHATTDAVKRMADHIVSQLAYVPVRLKRNTDATKRFMDNPPRPATIQHVYAEAITSSHGEPSSAGVRGGAAKPVDSLASRGIIARPIELTIDTGKGIRARLHGRHESVISNIRDRDIAVRFFIPGEISANDIFKDIYPRLAISTSGQLNGMWNTVSWLDDKVQPVQALEHNGYKLQYADAFTRGIGNACLVGEAAEILYGGDNIQSGNVKIETREFISELTEIAEAWCVFGGTAGKLGEWKVQSFNDLPVSNNFRNKLIK